MKSSDLKVQTTYVGTNGRRRHINQFHGANVVYDVPEGGEFMCTKETFARWAEREAASGEVAPRTA